MLFFKLVFLFVLLLVTRTTTAASVVVVVGKNKNAQNKRLDIQKATNGMDGRGGRLGGSAEAKYIHGMGLPQGSERLTANKGKARNDTSSQGHSLCDSLRDFH